MPARIAIIAILLSTPALAGAIPWHLCRDTPTWRLSLLAPIPLVHVHLPPYYRWEGTASSFEAEYRGADLVLTIHRDAYQTAWWDDCIVVQKPGGEVIVTWCSTRPDTDVTFAHYSSFRVAWRDNRVRRTLQPALCQLHQLLPSPDEAWEMIEWGM